MPETTGDEVLDAVLDRRRRERVLELEEERDAAERRTAEARMSYSALATAHRDVVHDLNNLRAYVQDLEAELERLSKGFLGKRLRQFGWGHR